MKSISSTTTPLHPFMSQEMKDLFSSRTTHLLWRRLWIALAEAQKEVGLPIRTEQIQAMKRVYEDISFLDIDNDDPVNVCLDAYSEQCPIARPIISWGATSAFARDNALLLQFHRGLGLLLHKGVQILREIQAFAKQQVSLPCLGEKRASATTVGKKMSLWLQDLLYDFLEIERRLSLLQFLGVKGKGGSQYTLSHLFEGEGQKVRQLDVLIAQKMGFLRLFSLTEEHYPSKQDQQIIDTLRGLAHTLHKIGKSVQQWIQDQEIEEREEKEASFPLSHGSPITDQLLDMSRWVRTLTVPYESDESAGASLSRDTLLRDVFFGLDAALSLLIHLTRNLVLHPEKMQQRLSEEIPYWATEEILSEALRKGGNREELYQKMRLYQQTALYQRKRGDTSPHPLLHLLHEDADFPLSEEELAQILYPSLFIGQAAEQVAIFFERELEPFLTKYQSLPNPIP